MAYRLGRSGSLRHDVRLCRGPRPHSSHSQTPCGCFIPEPIERTAQTDQTSVDAGQTVGVGAALKVHRPVPRPLQFSLSAFESVILGREMRPHPLWTF